MDNLEITAMEQVVSVVSVFIMVAMVAHLHLLMDQAAAAELETMGQVEMGLKLRQEPEALVTQTRRHILVETAVQL